MTNKRERQAAIRELIGSRAVSSQEELRRLLRARGWDVTQSTLSRDLRELRLARVPSPDGVRYAFLDGGGNGSSGVPPLEEILPPLFVRADGVGELVVIKTIPGGAQPVAVALDSEHHPDVVGTIGGDDTILVICRSAAARERLLRRVRSISARA